MIGVIAVLATSFERTYASIVVCNASDYAAGHCQPMPPPETPGQSQAKSGSVSCGVTVPFSWVLEHTMFFHAPKSLFPQSCGMSVINPTGLQSQIPRGFSVLLLDPQFRKSVVGPRTFVIVQELLW